MDTTPDYKELRYELYQLRINHPHEFHCINLPFTHTLIGGLDHLFFSRTRKGDQAADDFYKWWREFLNKYVIEGNLDPEREEEHIKGILQQLHEIKSSDSKPTPPSKPLKTTLF